MKIKLIHICSLMLFTVLIYACPVLARGEEEAAADPSKDSMGYWQKSKSYEVCAKAGAVAVEFPNENSFAVFWTPPNYYSGRVMVLLHGTGGTAYDEIKDELEMARRYGYMLISLQWLDRETNRYMGAADLVKLMDETLHYAESRFKADPYKAALCGFSRGGAISYEVAWLDAQDHKHLKFVICHSGGVPTSPASATRKNRQPATFLAKLNAGELADRGYHGLSFFLYSGDRDEQWGTRMTKQMENAQHVLTLADAKVVERVQDVEGGHAGYREKPEIHEKAVQYFLKLTE